MRVAREVARAVGRTMQLAQPDADICSVMTAGLRGFGAGLVARILAIAPGNAITWLIFEQVKAWLGRHR